MNTIKTRHHRLVLICLSLIFPLLTGSARAQCIVEGEGIDISVCLLEMPPYVFYGVPISGDTVFLDTIAGFPDCDTVIKVSITIQEAESRTIRLETCPGEEVFFDGQWLGAGSYLDTVQSDNGWCDTIRFILVSEKPLIAMSFNVSYCAGEEIPDICDIAPPWFDCTWPGQGGPCDTIVTINISELPLETTVKTFEVCPGDSLLYNGVWYGSEGSPFVDTIPSINGSCDTIATIVVVSSNSIDKFHRYYQCNRDTIDFMGEQFT